MQKIGLITAIWLIMAIGCTYQLPMVIEEPTTPRVVIKEVPAGSPAEKEKEGLYESPYLYPDLTRGYIENQAFPYAPKAWLLAQGRRILLIGPEKGPPEISVGEIREFNLPPGRHILHIERWRFFSYYGGWKKIRQVEVVKVSVAEFKPKRWRCWSDGHYGWKIIIEPERSQVYSGYVNW